MPYTIAWDETVPDGGMDADLLDDRMRDRMTAIRERMADVLGGLSLAEFQADPMLAKGIRGGGDVDFEVIGGTATTTIKDSTGVNNDFQIDHATGGTTIRGDLDAGGGFRRYIDGWGVTNIAASVAATEVVRAAGRPVMPRGGSILAVVVALAAAQARTGGTLTVEVWRGAVDHATGVRTDTATGLIAVIDAANPVVKATTQAKDLDTFLAGDEIFLKYATDAGWLPVTADFTASVEVEM